MFPQRRWLIGLAGLLAILALAFGLWRVLSNDGHELSPWLYCSTNPCQPLALFPLPTPPALTHNRSLAAACDFSVPGAGDGILLWHTDSDPRTDKGRCVSSAEADKLTGS